MKEKTRLISVRGNELLVLQKATSVKKYTLAGGVKKKKETAIEALIRETKEEIDVSLKLENLSFLCSTYVKKDEEVNDIIKHYFVYDSSIKKVKNNEPEKFKKVRWVPWNKAIDYLDKSDRNAVEFYFKEKLKLKA